MQPWDLKSQMLEEIEKRGGWANCHAHFDKAFYITKEGLDKTMIDMETKWLMSDDIKKKSTEEEVAARIRTALDNLLAQGVKNTISFVDAYEAVNHKAIDAALKVKEEYKDKINFKIAAQPLGGLINSAALELYEAITAKADIAGGLPSKDRPNDDANMYILFSVAKNLNKPLHVHIDQENNPNEHDTEKLIKYTKKFGYEGRVTAVHALSISALTKTKREEIYKQLADAGISVVVCPSAAISMRQLDQYEAPLHNSIANVPEMLAAGVNVGLGVDNICDFYQPFIDGDMWTEMRLLQEACRYYNFEELVKIASENGQKIINIK
ncbi:MAG: MGS domain protein [Parcubacteria group bacterium GW2011_GWA2_53_21]|nr:MAG: MGS domain protein [Parcubacteria group bacterium GW2011_GWA2_53_21]